MTLSKVDIESGETVVTATENVVRFGEALEALRTRKRVKRAGWNGAGQFVYVAFDLKHEDVNLRPVFVLRNAQGEHQPGWLPSMGDLMASDWVILEN